MKTLLFISRPACGGTAGVAGSRAHGPGRDLAGGILPLRSAPQASPPMSSRWLLICLLTLTASLGTAQDTPLIIPAKDGSNAVVINPGLGTAVVYGINDSNSSKKGECSWLAELAYHEKMVYQEQNGIPYSPLRIGFTNNSKSLSWNPTPEGLLEAIPNKLTKGQEQRLGAKDVNPQAQARDAEDKFWATAKDYDGKVAAAFDGQYLMLVIPAKHAVMFYEYTSQNLELRAVKGYGPELLVPSGFKTKPEPAAVFQALPKDQQDAALKAMDEKLLAVPAETPKSEVWCGALDGSVFVLVDTANRRLISYQPTGKDIETCIRDLQFDLMYESMFKSTPKAEDLITAFQKQWGPRLAELGYTELTMDVMREIVGQEMKGDASKAGALQAGVAKDLLALDFTAERKLLTFACRGTDIELVSARDYTIDSAIAVFWRRLNAKAIAATVIKRTTDSIRSLKPATALTQVTFALDLDPALFATVDKTGHPLKVALAKPLAQEWEAMIAAAQKKAEEQEAERKAAIEKANEKKKTQR